MLSFLTGTQNPYGAYSGQSGEIVPQGGSGHRPAETRSQSLGGSTLDYLAGDGPGLRNDFPVAHEK